jgi:hypothetical protein
MLQKFMNQCTDVKYLVRYIYVHLLVSLLCPVYSMHGYGLFKIKRKNLADHIVNSASFFYLRILNDFTLSAVFTILGR